MGVSVSSRRRAKALRARFLGPGFVPTDFGQPAPKEVLYDHPGHGVQLKPRAQAQHNEETQKLRKTAEAAATDARGMERLMERKRWSNA